MTVFCTYCSNEKDKSKFPLPAIQRYQSERIQSVYDAASVLDFKFLILSGKYGLLESDYRIPYYDHLLIDPEVSQHALLIADQLKNQKIKSLVFFAVHPDIDPDVLPYIKAIEKACEQVSVDYKWVELNKI